MDINHSHPNQVAHQPQQQQQPPQQHHLNQHHLMSDCVKDGTLAYIYVLEDSLLSDNSFQYQNEPVPKNYEFLKHLSTKSPDKLKNILQSPFTINPSSADMSENKEIFDFTKFFEVKDATIFHDNNSIKRYARFHLNLTLKFMGCKSIHARHITSAIFEQLEKCRVAAHSQSLQFKRCPMTPPTSTSTVVALNSNATDTIYCVGMLKSTFFYIVGYIISTYQYSKPQYISDFPVACDVQEKKHSFTILLGGTSGCGKSTLTALLASRIGFAAVISTDNIRQILRKFISRTESPILWASTYHAGEIISDPSLSHKEKILQGYEAQNEMIFNKLDVLIDHYEKRNESLIVEGVHLDTRLIVRLVKKHPSCIPFLMYISNEAKHKERFAIRSKYMTLDPHQNKYTKYFKNIRIINDYLCQGADSILVSSTTSLQFILYLYSTTFYSTFYF
ncbi:hypothetical protein PPL_01517 [Heterostelium album PN500]|uniref:2-phosphoglycerate kinase n=1 Tax=Heterostelium pallidum (strain ATCC 26659 / Pp 5 / PN500) TaxID=670386 RepID=D3AZH5_HETP5|nr:hypothetical protein PPL_01517 [Heterostelium album PN500]EFA85558.1 hypothetical protein PPL_01517 [Heterostelium album PN500]|eukprot:XP_020437666.1 hypothetical protein PPL_01517 [Heterostelium album PN500]